MVRGQPIPRTGEQLEADLVEVLTVVLLRRAAGVHADHREAERGDQALDELGRDRHHGHQVDARRQEESEECEISGPGQGVATLPGFCAFHDPIPARAS